MNVWHLTPHHKEPEAALAWTRKKERIAIGWGKTGDLSELKPNSAEEIGEKIKSSYTKDTMRNSGHGGASLWRLYNELQEGDLVIIRTKAGESVVMEVVGDYEFAEEDAASLDADYQHQRKAEVTELDPIRTLAKAKLAPASGENNYWALKKIGEIDTTAGLSR